MKIHVPPIFPLVLSTLFTFGLTSCTSDNDDDYIEEDVDNYIEATAIVLSQEELTLKIDETATLTYTIEPETATDQTVTWSSNNSKVVTVENGVLSALSLGTTYVFATCGDVSARCLVYVVYKDISEITLSESEIELELGSSYQITATVNENASSDDLIWTSTDETIATVSSNGTLSAIALGTCSIIASSPAGDVQSSCKVTVIAPKVTGITISGTYNEILEGQTFNIDYTITPSDAGNTDVIITSSDTSIVVVNSDGSLTAKAIGSATITVTTDDGGYYDTCEVTVVSIEYFISKDTEYGYMMSINYVGYYLKVTLNNNSPVSIDVTELSIYNSGSLVSSITYSETLAAEASLSNTYSVSQGSYSIIWTFTYNGNTYQK